MAVETQPGNRVGFGRVDLYQTHDQLYYRAHLMPTTLPMGLILLYPCPHSSGKPTLRAPIGFNIYFFILRPT